MADENEKLENYLKSLESYLDDYTISQRNEVVAAVRAEIINAAEVNEKTYGQVILSLGKEVGVLNRHLIQRGLSEVKDKKKRNFFKIFMISMFSFIVVVVLAIVILVKSITPLWKFDENDKTLSILGGQLTLHPDDQSFFGFQSKQMQDLDLEKIKISGEIPGEGRELLSIKGENVDFRISQHKANTVKYNCRSNKSAQEFLTELPNGYQMQFEGATKCLIYIPSEMKVSGRFANGFLDLTEMRQDLDIELINGNINWRQVNSEIYSLTSKIRNGNTQGDTSRFSDSALYKAEFTIGNGNLKLFDSQ